MPSVLTGAPKERAHKSRSKGVCTHFWPFGTSLNKVHTRAPGLRDKWGFGAGDEAGCPAAAKKGQRGTGWVGGRAGRAQEESRRGLGRTRGGQSRAGVLCSLLLPPGDSGCFFTGT